MTANPLGKYANVAAVVAAFAVLGVWLLLTIFRSLDIGTGPSADLNLFAVLAVGVLIGNGGMLTQAQTIAAEKLNGQKESLAALHRRLDSAGIPPEPQ